MTCDQNSTAHLYATAIPVLLGNASVAGKTARETYLRHGISPHWFGKGRDIRLGLYALRHPLPAPMVCLSDELLLQILRDFAAEQCGLLTLYPCDDEAKDFTERHRDALENRFVLLPLPEDGDLLAPLVRKN